MRSFCAVIQRMEAADFIEAALAVESIEIMRVARCELARFQITAAQVCIAKCLGTLAREKMKAQPTPVHARNALGFSKERDKQKQNQISIDLRLELQIAGKIFGSNFAGSALELKRRMQSMIEFLHEHDQRSDIAITHSCTGIVLFELFNQPARIINADVKLISSTPQKCSREFAQFTRRFSRQNGQLRTAPPIDETIFQIDPDLRVRAFK